jgi:hypothetical protein
MPSTSEAQRRKMAVLYKQGKISKASWEKYKVIRRTKKK